PEIGKSLCRVRRQNGNLGGYRTDILVENISKTEMAALVCKRCQGILRKACFSATSGEHFCKCCKNLLEQAQPNGQVRKIIHSLKSSCPLYDRGCEGIGKLGKCAKHLNICEYVYEQCELGCEIVLPRHELKIHMREHCVKREITCEYCDQYFKVCDMGYHMTQCDKIPLTRELGCDTVMCRENMAQHLENSCRVEEGM
ncbi:TNF receptor-associated factor 2-like, partial [Oopsacas minuta]